MDEIDWTLRIIERIKEMTHRDNLLSYCPYTSFFQMAAFLLLE